MKKILVTGANGYIGRHVIQELKKKNVEIIANDIRFDCTESGIMYKEIDIFSRDPKMFEKLGSPDICLHLAWQDGFIHNSKKHMEKLSEHYTFICNMIDSGLSHIAVMGTMHEVGYYEGPINEDTPCNPQSMYAIAKNALRQSLAQQLSSTEVTFQWLRGFYIYGDDSRSNSIFNKITIAEKGGKKKFPFTTGKNKYDFIHIDDFAKQIVACVMQDRINGIINCCSGKPISLSDKIEGYLKENNYRIELDYGAFPDRPYDSPAIWGDNSKINRIMGIDA